MAWGMKNTVICLLGSSIMEGRIGVDDPQDRWYNQCQRLLSNAFPTTCFPVINSAVGGESTREIMARLERDVVPYQPDYCLFMVGANNHDCQNPQRILAPGELEALFEQYVAGLPAKTQTIGVVLNPIVDDCHFVTSHPAYQDYLAPYQGSLDAALEEERQIARSFYARQGWPCLDLAKLMAHDPRRYILASDGIHLSPAGHTLFAQSMFELFKTLLPKEA